MYSWDNAQVVLVGNKCDLEQDRAVTQERGQRLADQLGNSFRVAYGCTLFVLLLLLSAATCETGFLLGDYCPHIYLYVVSYVLLFVSRVLQINTHSWEKTPVILIGNKSDMANERVVQSEEAVKLADALGTFASRISPCKAYALTLTHPPLI